MKNKASAQFGADAFFLYIRGMKLRIAFMGMVLAAVGISASAVRMHCAQDTVEIVKMLETVAEYPSFGKRVATAAELLTDRPADSAFSQDSTYSLMVNVDSFTPLSFVNTTLAMASASEYRGGGWRAFAEQLKNFSCRKGEDDGFASLFFHTSDWLGDNIYRGNLTEITGTKDARSMTASLDYLTVNRDKFAALKDENQYDRVRMAEMGFRSHKIPFLPKQAAGEKWLTEMLRDGDIIIMVSDKGRSDYFEIGIVKMEDDGAHLIHFDHKKGKVVKEADNLKRYFNLNSKYFNGFRIVRKN